MTSSEMKAFIETPHERTLWGTPHMVTPGLCSEVLGDGRQFLIISPMMHRPNYFVVRIDSHIGIDSDKFFDLLDEIYEAIEQEFEWDFMTEKFGSEWEDDECREGLFDGGSCWGTWKLRDLTREFVTWKQLKSMARE